MQAFGIEIDPINPNVLPVHIDVKHSFLIFDGVPSQNDLSEGHGIDVNPQSNSTAASDIPNFKDFVVFPEGSKKLTGIRTGRYHYEFKFGPDEDTATRPFEINGTVTAYFNHDGTIVGDGIPLLTPDGDKRVTYNPERCKFFWLENPDNAKDSQGVV